MPDYMGIKRSTIWMSNARTVIYQMLDQLIFNWSSIYFFPYGESCTLCSSVGYVFFD